MNTKYSKSYGNMWRFKDGLTNDNERLVKIDDELTTLYNKQTIRNKCKICGSDRRRYEYHARGTKYFCCDVCGHINGFYEDTNEFCKVMYENDDGLFGGYYEDDSREYFVDRMNTIYSPKCDFLVESLISGGVDETDIKNLKVLDIGAGSGHFVRAMQEKGLNALGVEADAHQVKHTNEMWNTEVLIHCESENMADYVSDSEADVVSCIYAFEHIINVVEIFDVIQKNQSIKWIYFSVPTFSLCSMLDSVNPDVYPRVLHAAHTHIYTNESIQWLCNKYKWEKIGEWRFGSDAADLLRHIMVKAMNNGDYEYAQMCKTIFVPMIDEIQHVIDKHQMCSDSHILVRKLY